MGPGIYFDERHQRRTDPDEAAANGYGPSRSATSFNRGEKFAGLAVDLIDNAIARIEGPNWPFPLANERGRECRSIVATT